MSAGLRSCPQRIERRTTSSGATHVTDHRTLDRASVRLPQPAGLYDPVPNGYSHVAVVAPGTRLVLVAGQGGENETQQPQPDFRAQVRQAFHNLGIALAAAGVRPSDVARLTVLVVDHTEDKLHVFGDELEQAFGAGPKPTCTLIPVPRLALDGMLFEVEAVAVLAA